MTNRRPDQAVRNWYLRFESYDAYCTWWYAEIWGGNFDHTPVPLATFDAWRGDYIH